MGRKERRLLNRILSGQIRGSRTGIIAIVIAIGLWYFPRSLDVAEGLKDVPVTMYLDIVIQVPENSAEMEAEVERQLREGENVRPVDLLKLGNIAWAKGDIEKAESYYQTAQSMPEFANDSLLMGSVLVNLGNTSVKLGRESEALERYEAAFDVFTSIGDSESIALTLNNMGGLYHSISQFELAVVHLSQARGMFEALYDTTWIGKTSTNIGKTQMSQYNYEEAIEAHKYARLVYGAQNSIVEVANSQLELAQTYLSMGRGDTANIYLDSILSLEDRYELVYQKKRAEYFKATLLISEGKYVEAEKKLRSCLSWFELKELVSEQSDVWTRLSEISNIKGLGQERIEYIRKALGLADSCNNEENVICALGIIGGIYAISDKKDSAVICLSEALELAEENRDIKNQAICKQYLGITFFNEGIKNKNGRDFDVAGQYYEESIKLSYSVDWFEHAIGTKLLLGRLMCWGGRGEEGLKVFKSAKEEARERNMDRLVLSSTKLIEEYTVGSATAINEKTNL